MDVIELDKRRRATLPKSARHERYIVTAASDGTLTLTPAVIRSALEDELRQQRPGFIEQLERDASDPARAVEFDWRHA